MVTRRAVLAAAPLALLAAPRAARAQGFPSRPIRMVVPFAAGGAVDLTARVLAERLQPILGQPIIVDNRGGAGGNIGADVVAKAEKDGHTLLVGNVSILVANPYLYRRSMPFDPVRDLAPVTRVATGTILLVVNADRPWRTAQELLAAAKARPGAITMGSSGTGTVSHLTLAALNRAAGVEITHVPYRGGGPAFADLAAGTIDMMFDVIPAAMPYVRAGRFRPLAVGSAERIGYVPELRDVPSIGEILPGSGIDVQTWYSVSTTGGTPADRIDVLHRAIREVAGSEAFRARMEPLGFTPVTDETPAAFGAYMQSQDAAWRSLVESSGATLD